nr:MAG TPA: hypothetical protein [Crassvirales sp.]
MELHLITKHMYIFNQIQNQKNLLLIHHNLLWSHLEKIIL